ncbi:uncharacterized protein G2W53_041818 [Senna tora]|uniref:Uncharacterized protein n=1 Tax=Senna tora TaxID=362788 RepID=A0A834SFY6_9FABA|nr:uncharacterized protein G2W53_041818 [Senna tora]
MAPSSQHEITPRNSLASPFTEVPLVCSRTHHMRIDPLSL